MAERLDVALAARGLARSRTHAVTLITGGLVTVDGRPVVRASAKVGDEQEIVVLLKTRSARLDALRAAFDELHPYKVPELLALPVEAGTEKYLDWINGETTLALT